MIIWFWIAVGFILLCFAAFWPWQIPGKARRRFRVQAEIRQLHNKLDALLEGSDTLATAPDPTGELWRFLAAVDIVVARKELPEDLRNWLLEIKAESLEAYRKEVEELPPHPGSPAEQQITPAQ